MWGVRDYSFAPLSQSLLRTQMDKSRQVPVKGWEILCFRDTDGQVLASPSQSWRNLLSEDLQARSNEREINHSLMAGKHSFVRAYLNGDSHLRGSTHGSYPSTQECHVGRRRWVKKGPTTMRVGVWHQIPHEVMPACWRRGALHQMLHIMMPACWGTHLGLLPEACPFLLDLPCRCTCLLPKAGHTAATLPLRFCFGPLEQRAMGCCWIMVVTIPSLHNSCFFPTFSITHFPFSITLICNSHRPPLPHHPNS